MKRLFAVAVAVVLLISHFAVAQKADAAFVLGGSFVSDAKTTVLVPPFPAVSTNIKTDHHFFFEGALGVRVLNAKAVSLHVDVPFVGVPSTTLTESTTATTLDHLTTLFITPGLKIKFAPGAPVSPWAVVGGGWGHYHLKDASITQNKGVLEYGGGLDFKTGIHNLGFRGEVRDFVTGTPDFGLSPFITTQSGLHHHNILLGGGIVLRF